MFRRNIATVDVISISVHKRGQVGEFYNCLMLLNNYKQFITSMEYYQCTMQ
jgi:hypothetical protein